MKVIGLTGGISSGKSTVSRILNSEFGIPVIDADLISRQVVEPGGKSLEQIKNIFGQDYLTEDGAMDRVKMGKLIRKDPEAKKNLEAILHPAIEKTVKEEIDQYKEKGTELVIYDCPLLIEADQEKFVDFIALVVTTLPVRIERLMERDGITEEEARQKIAIQMSDEEKKKYADFIIYNDCDRDSLKEELNNFVKKLKNYKKN